MAHADASKKECSLQEAVYQIMPVLCLKEVFPGLLYVNSNIPEKLVKMMLSKKEIAELPEYSTDIYTRNMMNRYMIRPHDALFEQLRYALFIRRYYLQTKPIENDSQHEELVDELIERNHPTNS